MPGQAPTGHLSLVRDSARSWPTERCAARRDDECWTATKIDRTRSSPPPSNKATDGRTESLRRIRSEGRAMSTLQPIVVAQMPSRRAVIATLLVASFSIGMIVGAVAVRTLESRSRGGPPCTGRARPVPWRQRQQHERRGPWGAVRSGLVPRRRRLQHVGRCPSRGERRRLVPRGAPAQHERRRPRGAATGPVQGVAENNMSDAANRATWGRDR